MVRPPQRREAGDDVRRSAVFRLPVLVTAVLIAAGLVGAVAPAAVAAPGPVAAAGGSTVTADALPTVQIDGVAWSQAIVGTTVYVAGRFGNARPAGAAPGTHQTPRGNVLAYDLATGALTTRFAPSTNAQVLSVAGSPDGSRVYIAGDFTSVSGVTRNRVAAFDTRTGALIASFAPKVDSRVKTIIATNDRVYIGGGFTTVNGAPRTRLAAIRASDGAVLGWAPSADFNVNALLLTPDRSRVIVGGAFKNVSGVPAYGLAAVDAASGAVLPWAANKRVRDAGPNAGILGLSTDGTNVYGNGYVYVGGGGNLEGTFSADPNSGAIHWVEDCHGDTYGSFPINGVVYTVSHAHACGNMGGFGESVPRGVNMRHAVAFTAGPTGTINHETHGYADWFGQPSPSIVNWFPDLAIGSASGQSQAAWTVTGTSRYVVLGGEFPTVNGVGQQGLVRFAVTPIAPGKRGPVLTGSAFTPTLTSPTAGTVHVAFPANYDQDNLNLTYRVVRDGNTAAPVYQTSVDSTFWNRPNITFTDTGLTPGTTHQYRLYVQDPTGNAAVGGISSITVAKAGVVSGYSQTVLSQGASIYWRFGEASGSTAIDAAGSSNGSVGVGVAGGAQGAIVTDPGTADTFDGTVDAVVATRAAASAPNVTNAYSASVWFRTTTRTGGEILGYGDERSRKSLGYDRNIYLDNAGHLNFGVWPGHTATVTSPGTYRDGLWHQAVCTLGPAGMVLYVDGKPVAARSDTTSAADIYGYWRVGGDNLAGWPNQPTTSSFTGDIDDVSIYPTTLTAAQVTDQWAASGRGGNTPSSPPVAAFTSQTSWLTVTVNASGSAASGSIASYSWNFGDGSPAVAGLTAAHTYQGSGTYQVTLTVTDIHGASSSLTRRISATTRPTAPGAVVPLSPARILDTRAGLGAAGPVPSTGSISVQVTGRGGVPATGVSAVAVNVTVVDPSTGGYITVWPSGTPRQETSNLNFQPGQTVPNLVVVPVGADGKIKLYNGSPGTVQLIADVAGYTLAG